MLNSKEAQDVLNVLQQTSKAAQDLLWARQLVLYPRSVRLTPQQVIEWALAPDHRGECYIRERRLRAVVMALQDPVHVWYRLPGMGLVTGCRYGLDGPEYLSNFSDL